MGLKVGRGGGRSSVPDDILSTGEAIMALGTNLESSRRRITISFRLKIVRVVTGRMKV